MANELRRVSRGESVEISAELWNGFLEMYGDYLRKRTAATTAPVTNAKSRSIYFQNESGSLLAVHSIVAKGDPLVSPAATDTFFFQAAAFKTAAPSPSLPFWVLQEPADTERIAEGIAGDVWCKVFVNNVNDRFASPGAGNYAHLVSQAVGPAGAEILSPSAPFPGTGEQWALVRIVRTRLVAINDDETSEQYIGTTRDHNYSTIQAYPVPKAYDPTFGYQLNDLVSYSGVNYRALKTISGTPVTPGTDPTKWEQIGNTGVLAFQGDGIIEVDVDYAADNSETNILTVDTTDGIVTLTLDLPYADDSGHYGIVMSGGSQTFGISPTFQGGMFAESGTTSGSFTISPAGVAPVTTVGISGPDLNSWSSVATFGLQGASRNVLGTSWNSNTRAILGEDPNDLSGHFPATADTPSYCVVSNSVLYTGGWDLLGTSTGGLEVAGGLIVGGSLSVNLTTQVTNTLPLGNGGTGNTTGSVNGGTWP